MTSSPATPIRKHNPGDFPLGATIDTAGRIILEGELDVGGVDALHDVLEQALLEPRDIVIDVSGLSFIDSRAITELLWFQLRAAALNRHLRLVRLSPPVTRVIDLLDLRHLLVAPVSESSCSAEANLCSR